MIKTFNLEKKIILVTGGYGYLGKAITESLLYHGAKVYVLARGQEKFNAAFIDLDKKYSDNLSFEECDISDTQQLIASFKNIHDKEGRIDILINNAFYIKGQSPETMTDEEWAYGLQGTLGTVFSSIREIIPYFKTQGNGKIINVSSMYGVVAPQFDVYDDFPAFLNPPHYGAAKAGIIQLSKYYASYLGHLNINVNTVTPGPFPSEEVQKNVGFVQNLKDKTSLGRIGLPEDLAGAFVFLSSEASNFITGQNIIIDGGWITK